jgi:parallel beta-helix repeat protein
MTYYELACVALLSFVSAGVSLAKPTPPAIHSYYVSSTSGNDANDGLSPEKAWQHLSKIYLKSFSKDTFQPGDNILLKRGDQWDGQIRLQGNGTATKPITLGAYGEGQKPLIYGDNEDARWESVAGHNGLYTADMGQGSILGSIFLDGKALKIIYPAGSLNQNEDMETFLARLQPGTLAGQFGSRLWVRLIDDRPPNESLRIFRSAGVSVANSHYVQIENLDIQRFYVGIDVSNSQQVLVHHNDIQDVLGIGIYLRSADTNCRVESNTVFRSGNTALYVLKGAGNTFRDNWVSRVSAKILGINVSGDGMGVGLQESQNTLIEHNYFAHSGGIDFYYEQDSTVRYNYFYRVTSAGAPHGVNLQVYGNIYNLRGETEKPGSTGINAVATGPGTIVVFNNTIYHAAAFFLMGSSAKGGAILFSNNIAFAASPGAAMTIFGANVESDHNCYFSVGQPDFRYNNTSFSSLRTYQQASRLDRTSFFSDPQFASSAPTAPIDFRISAASTCNSPASTVPLADSANGRTYDHDQNVNGDPVIGALRPEKRAEITAISCISHCFQRTFTVPNGVYLVRLQFAPEALLRQHPEFSFVLNDRKVAVEFEPSADYLDEEFLVRPERNLIKLQANANADCSIVTNVEIISFDSSHGDGAQVVPW